VKKLDSGMLNQIVTKFAQAIKNITLVTLLFLLTILMFKQVYTIGVFAINNPKQVHLILEQLLNFFLYLAFFSMIVVHFKNGEYFQLRYLVYVGITVTLRYIIVNKSDAMQNLLLSIVIVLLIIGYLLLTPAKTGFRSYLNDKGRKDLEQKGTSIQ
jgi:protein PsiE